MRRILAILACASVVLSSQAAAQTNNNANTPLGSRIRHDRQFPNEPRSTFATRELSRVGKERGRDMVNQFASCLYERSNEDALALLAKTDFGFVNFEQIGMTESEVLANYAIETCLYRVAASNESGLSLRYTPDAMRRWLLAEAYLDRNPDGPAWVKPGHVIDAREYPLSRENPVIVGVMDFADCVVAHDPHAADFFFRTKAGSAEEQAAIQGLMPVLGPCILAGQEVRLQPAALRLWLGEGLWHASNNSSPPSAENSEEAAE